MKTWCLSILLFISVTSTAQFNQFAEQTGIKKSTPGIENPPPFYTPECSRWADSVMNTLTPDERIGQLFMIAAYSDTASKHTGRDAIHGLSTLITEQKIGGLIFFKGSPTRQAEFTNTYQSLSKVPLLIGMDAEWGLAMRLDSVPRFPFQMTLGAMQPTANNYKLIADMGAEIASECKRLGVQEDFAPVVDINDNPENPVIGLRSFGEEKRQVAIMGEAYMEGLQNEHVLACAKHFPGHGDTKTDSHLSLPLVDASYVRLDTLELYPFEKLFNKGVSSVMVAHLFIPSLDSTPNRASTLSPKIVDSLLKNVLNFKGLVFTDALNMQGVAKYYPPGIVDVKALLAGNDVLLFSENVPKAVEEIKMAIKKKEITQEDIDLRCRKILMAKAWAGLNHYKSIETKNLVKDLNSTRADYLNRVIAKNTITLLSNKKSILPLKRLDTLKIASLVIGDSSENNFQKRLDSYTSVTHFNIRMNSPDSVIKTLYPKLSGYNLIIIGLNHTNSHPADTFGLTYMARHLIDTLEKNKSVILDLFSDPYILPYLPLTLATRAAADAVIMSYQDTPYLQDYSAQLIFGGIGAEGKLPVTASFTYKRNTGIITEKTRMEYTTPEDAGMDADSLAQIDSIAAFGLRQKAYPGCVILAARNGKVFYNKAFGYQNYNDTNKVKTDDIYDLASITKIAATTAALMKLADDVPGKLNLYSTLPSILPEAKKSNKKKILVKDILLHQSGLKADIWFWKKTMNGSSYRKGVYSADLSATFPIPVAAHLYLRKDFKDSILKDILKSDIDKKPVYRYSDLGFILMGYAIKNISGTPLDQYLEKSFYKPLGLQTMSYNPIYKYPIKRIIPTEYDSVFRKQQLRGYVHDPSAAMLGGVAGNAGLFSDANDLAVMMQMFLNKGMYGGEKYIDSATVIQFTNPQTANSFAGNRRGLGFDKPEPDTSKESPACRSASSQSYGHSGFTGTYTWADPKNGIVYVFLSNRVASGSADNKLIKLNIRTEIQQVLYNAVK